MKEILIGLFAMIIEKWLLKITCTLFTLIFCINKLFTMFYNNGEPNSLELGLYNYYDILIQPNIGTITTVASIFIGIYITVITVIGGIKVNSVMALISENDLGKIVSFIITGLIYAFAIVFYSFITEIITSNFVQAFFYFLFLIAMLSTALRFGINLCLIYTYEFKKLTENLEAERKELEKNQYIMSRLESYLEDVESERLRNSNSE
ncbi:hypothetical protein [Paenibacillus bovis]|uniref:Uncharacterized protein n=1 Tax=Paenibacillus bovis TaxID=1616788 RepID=A0A172ZJX3_9BACL|nr:hypothetical protein [Paenibacillus bovis]ANF97440.1 hypothetical protein AR543_16445 [Paenibacillus bovis]